MTAKHTPTPWKCDVKVNGEQFVLMKADKEKFDGDYIVSACSCCNGAHCKPEDAAFIVRAVNAHDELLAALKWAERMIDEESLSSLDMDEWRKVEAAITKVESLSGNGATDNKAEDRQP